GVFIALAASGNTIGGTTPGARNVLSGNRGSGVWIEGAGTTGNVVAGNFIGTDVTGTAALAHRIGVRIIVGGRGNTIGGTSAGAGNVISGNVDSGVWIQGAGTTGNVVAGNFIGTNADGTAALGNGADGVLIDGGASSNTIGGPTPDTGNVIAFNR